MKGHPQRHMEPEILFSKLDGYSVMEAQKRSMTEAIAGAPESLISRADDEVVAEFVERFRIDVPKLLRDKMSTSDEEVDIDVSRDPRRMFVNEYPNGFFIKGTRITVHVPFTGESVVFGVRPNAWSSSMPRAVVGKNELQLPFTFTHDQPPPDIKPQLDRTLNEIQSYLDRCQEMVNSLHAELEGTAKRAWETRKTQFAQRKALVSNLGLPQRPQSPLSTDPRSSLSRAPAQEGESPRTRDWDVFISHASEDKESFVKPLAAALSESGFRVVRRVFIALGRQSKSQD